MPKASTSSAPSAPPLPFEAALAELERLVSNMENGQLPLDQLLHSYKRGAELLQQCRQQLQAVDEQVKVFENAELKTWTAS
jgi:exodeoxyribonuclease VII small subunit